MDTFTVHAAIEHLSTDLASRWIAMEFSATHKATTIAPTADDHWLQTVKAILHATYTTSNDGYADMNARRLPSWRNGPLADS